MRAEHHRVLTSDELLLNGAVFWPDDDPVGAVVLVHGMGGSRLEHPYQWWLAEAVTAAGWMCVIGDNRGAATVKEFYDTQERSRYYGCALELVTESPADVGAWCSAAPATVDRIVLAGHSLGASKVVLGATEDPRIVGLALLAPADMVALVESVPQLARGLEAARPQVAEGRGDRLVDDFQYEGWSLISGNTLWQWRERGAEGDVIDGSRPDAVTPLANVSVPIVTIIGGADTCMVVRPEVGVANLEAQAINAPWIESHVLPGVDHHYTDARDELIQPFVAFLDRV